MSLNISKVFTSLVCIILVSISIENLLGSETFAVSAMKLAKRPAIDNATAKNKMLKPPRCKIALSKEDEEKLKSAYLKCFKPSATASESDTTGTGTTTTEKSKKDGKRRIVLSFNTTLEDFDYDDKCKTHCWYKELDSLTEDGKLKENDMSLSRGNYTEAMKTKLNELWKTCKTKSETIAAQKSLTSCKVATLHSFCLKKEYIAQKDYLTKLCW